MRVVGISTPQIYGATTYQCGGYDKLTYRKKDVYNQAGRQWKLRNDDAKSALQFLSGLEAKDPLMFF